MNKFYVLNQSFSSGQKFSHQKVTQKSFVAKTFSNVKFCGVGVEWCETRNEIIGIGETKRFNFKLKMFGILHNAIVSTRSHHIQSNCIKSNCNKSDHYFTPCYELRLKSCLWLLNLWECFLLHEVQGY